MKELQMIHLQEEHIVRLQLKLKEQKRKFIDSLVSTPGWEEFLLKHSKTYFRPKNGPHTLKSATHGGKFGIEFPGGDSSKVQIIIGYSGKGINFRSASIPVQEIEEFIALNENTKKEEESKQSSYAYSAWRMSAIYYEVI